MEITTQLDGDEMRIALRGRLDSAWSNTVNKTLEDTVHGGIHRIALDLSQVSYLSSAGIRVLVMLTQNLKAIGGTLRLIDPSPNVIEVLNLVGFQQLLDTAAIETVQKTPLDRQENTESRRLKLAGNNFEVYTLNENAIQKGEVIENHEKSLKRPVILKVSEDTWIIGQGILGGSGDNRERTGELLAVSGLAITLPADDPAHPDWMQKEGDLVPEVNLNHGLKAVGKFRYLLRFGENPETPPLRLSELAQAALEICSSETVSCVLVAETAHLIGAALQTSPDRCGDDLFAYPSIRDRLLFTAEPAYMEETCLIVGVIARNPILPLATQVRPIAEGSDVHIHVHAGIVPFNPMRKGFIDLPKCLNRLMDTQTIRGVLHLLNDDREHVGAGESYLHRGALWCAPVDFYGRT